MLPMEALPTRPWAAGCPGVKPFSSQGPPWGHPSLDNGQLTWVPGAQAAHLTAQTLMQVSPSALATCSAFC